MAEVIVYYPERNGERDPAYIEGGIVGNLIRCKDCKHYTGGLDGYCEKWFRKTGGNLFFCADGEKIGT